MKIKQDLVHLPIFPQKEMTMRAHQIMTRNAITVLPETPILEAAHKMLENHVSGLPVLDASSKLVGIVSESDFLRRSEIGTQQNGHVGFSTFSAPPILPTNSFTNAAARSKTS
jgi:CBS domain-containing protein